MRLLLLGDPENDLAESGVSASLRAYLDWRSFGALPISGGINDQDPDVLRDFRLIHGLVAEHQERQAKRKNKR